MPGTRFLPTTSQRKGIARKERRRPRPSARPGERYSPKRLAQFLLQNAVDAVDYAAARREVKKLGLDSDAIPHDRPTDV
jgi:hypothetical protein